jgi:hypothetical protein
MGDAFLCELGQVRDFDFYEFTPIIIIILLIPIAILCSAWIFCIALQLWLAIVKGYKKRKLDAIRPYMVAFSSFLAALAFIPLGVGNIGHEWTGGTLHMCLNKITTQPKFWHYAFGYAPVFIFSFILPICLVGHSVYVVTKAVDWRRSSFTDRQSSEVTSTSPMQKTISEEGQVSEQKMGAEAPLPEIDNTDASISRPSASVSSSWMKRIFGVSESKIREFWKLNHTVVFCYLNSYNSTQSFRSLYF